VGCKATDLVAQHSRAVEERVRGLFSGSAAAVDDYDDAGPAFEDPFDPEDYPVPDDNCAQQ